jgi:hypothetical protein
LCHVLEVDRLNLYLHGAELLNEERIARIDSIVTRRATRYPLQYILEESWFYGRKFFVSPAVMAPTPETELLCEQAIKFLGARETCCPRALDVGVGRGAGASACILLYQTPLSDAARERLKVIYENTDGFEIARRDLELRGPGEFLGARQSGVPMLRFADINADLDLLEAARDAADELIQRHPEAVERHLARWLSGRQQYLKA